MALPKVGKTEEHLKAIKRQNYFKRVKKRLQHRNVVEINKSHPKYLFTQYIRISLRRLLANPTITKKEFNVQEKDFGVVKEDTYECVISHAVLHFRSFAPKVFFYIRHMMGLTPEDYLETVSPVDDHAHYLEFLANSKSGQNFFLTTNKQFMIKTVTKKEAHFFMKILPSYMNHFRKYPHSLLVKFLGLHSIKIKVLQKPIYFIVMMNIFHPDDRITCRYDIKACQIGRFTKHSEENNPFVVLKEKNWADGKLKLGSQRDWFLKQVKFDTEFLKKIGVLDYSLIIGVQSLHLDEVKKNKDLASVVIRAQRSFGRTSTYSLQIGPEVAESPSVEPTSSGGDFVLPGMVEAQTCSKACVVEADTGESHIVCRKQSTSTNPRDARAQPSVKDVSTCNHPLTYHTTQDIFGRREIVSDKEAILQNRRLLPEYKNELHVIDGEERYFLGIIDFFTRYTLKKKLENAYKRVLYPPLSFSTVPPDVFAERFNKFWVEHTE